MTKLKEKDFLHTKYQLKARFVQFLEKRGLGSSYESLVYLSLKDLVRHSKLFNCIIPYY